MTNQAIAISIKNVNKSYRLYDNPLQILKEALHPFRKKYHHDFAALHDISFNIPKGETVGILGRNGSGKSTLLQIICGILQPTTGNVVTSGRISALLELGAGFNPNFTGRSNVYMNGALMGFSRAEMDAQMESIEEFADIGEFIDQPAKTYSSGMYIRLAFACAINVKPDILIVDEALSVGDVFFQQKCYAKIRDIIAGGTTCLFVSHDTQAIMNICNHAILLRNGEIDYMGPPEEAVSRYYSTMGKRPPAKTDITSANVAVPSERPLMPSLDVSRHSILRSDVKRHGAGELQIAAARVTDTCNIDTLEVCMMHPLLFHVLLTAKKSIWEPSVGIHLHDRFGNLVFAAGSRQLGKKLPPIEAGQSLVIEMQIFFNVQPGEYTFSLGAAEPSAEDPNAGFTHDRIESLGPILVTAERNTTLPFYGIAQLPMNLSFQTTQTEA